MPSVEMLRPRLRGVVCELDQDNTTFQPQQIVGVQGIWVGIRTALPDDIGCVQQLKTECASS